LLILPLQDKFCEETDCIINRIYDQSPRGNHLDIAPGGWVPGPDAGVNATAEKLTLGGGHPVCAAYSQTGNGYRNDHTTGIATHDEAETMYMVTSGKHFNSGCCFDYGNAKTGNRGQGPGTMEAVYFGNAGGRLSHHGPGAGPCIMADMEDGLWAGNMSGEPAVHDFVTTAVIRGDVSTTETPVLIDASPRVAHKAPP
jgi:hypothetical protein